MGEKTIREICERLMTMEGSDVAFDCRQECLDLCEIVACLQAKAARQEMELASLQEQLHKLRLGN